MFLFQNTIQTHGITIQQPRTEGPGRTSVRSVRATALQPSVALRTRCPTVVGPLSVLLRPPKSSGLLVATFPRQRPFTLPLMGWGPGCQGWSQRCKNENLVMGSFVTTMDSHSWTLGSKPWNRHIVIKWNLPLVFKEETNIVYLTHVYLSRLICEGAFAFEP